MDEEPTEEQVTVFAWALIVGLVTTIWLFIKLYGRYKSDELVLFGIMVYLVIAIIGGTIVGSAVGRVVKVVMSLWSAAQKAQAKTAKEGRERKFGHNAQFLESTLDAVKSVETSEAARKGWLGEVDFDPDIEVITEKFQKAQALQKVVDKLSALDKPTAEDKKLLQEADASIKKLETVARERVDLIAKCANGAQLIDESLRHERADTKTSKKRAELHAELSSLLYGMKATPDTTPSNLAADSVMARVQAYREIKNQIQQARDETTRS